MDTLKELFEGNEPLFRGLAVHDGWDWSVRRPVVRLDFGSGSYGKIGRNRPASRERRGPIYTNGIHWGAPGGGTRRRSHVGQVNFRMKEERLSLIDRAAAIRGVTRTEFVLRSSEAAAIETLVERPIIALDDEAYDAFVAALDAPVASNDRLKRQLARRPQWER